MNIGNVVDMDLEDFEKQIRDLKLTDLINLKKFLEVEYSKVENVKNMILNKIEEKPYDRELKANLNDLYSVLQRLENRAKVVETLKEDRQVRY